MNTFFPLILFASVLPSANAPRPADRGPAHGKVLVLENDQTLAGDIERAGDLYRVRRLIGETTVPADRVLRLCADMEEAYAFLRGLRQPHRRRRAPAPRRVVPPERAARSGPDGSQGGRGTAPDDPGSRRLLAYLQETGPAKTAPAKTRTDGAEEVPRIPVDLTEESLGQFATKVQPILMNACANCHGASHGGAFRLTRSYDSAVLNRKTLQQNLAAVLAEVNPDQPRSSRLLSKAVSVHGPLDQAPIKNRQSAAYRTLEDWVKATLADNPQLHDRPTTAAAPPVEVRPVGFAEQTAPPAKSADVPKAFAPPTVKEAPEPTDPYSPDAFNRQFHADPPKPAGAGPKPIP